MDEAWDGYNILCKVILSKFQNSIPELSVVYLSMLSGPKLGTSENWEKISIWRPVKVKEQLWHSGDTWRCILMYRLARAWKAHEWLLFL